MNTCFDDDAWYHALTLTERIARPQTLERSTVERAFNADAAQRRMERWRSQTPFASEDRFTERLASDAITEDQLFYLLGEPIAAVRDRFSSPPAWLTDLSEAFSSTSSHDAVSIPAMERDQEMPGFLDAIAPLINRGRDRLRRGVHDLTETWLNLPFDPATIDDLLFTSLPGQLFRILSRTMILELNVARLEGLLEGNTPDERFRSFLHRIRQRDRVLALLAEYPVLARQLAVCIDRWAAFSLEFLEHLCADWDAIQTELSPEQAPGVLVEVESGMGDAHRGGRSVLIVRFNSGFQLVYKPKPLAVDEHFQELLVWLNERGAYPPFRTLKLLDRGAYGWSEFVAVESCTSADDVRRFYERQGSYLALLYSLEATDFHAENLIAAGEHPVLIDLESLFHPRVKGIDATQPDLPASNTMMYSVLRVGLLPQRVWSNNESEGIDLSGLGALTGQLTPQGVPFWEGAGTDEMRLARKRMEMPGSSNRPTLHGGDVKVQDYAEATATGFARLYRLLLERRDELLSDNGPLSRFAQDDVRVVLRATMTYGLLLQESFHPDLLRNALDRDRFFDQLWSGVKQVPSLAKVIHAEREDLQRGDIPLFTTRPNSRALQSANEQFPNFFEKPGLTLVQDRLQQLSEKDLERQLWFIRASFATLSVDLNHLLSYRPAEPGAKADRERLLTGARAIGDRLDALALRSDNDVSWIGVTSLNGGRHWGLVPLGTDLYEGLPGIVLFLAYLGAITSEQRYTNLSQTALTALRAQLAHSQSVSTAIGGFAGWGGVIYTLTHLAELWNEPALLAEAEEIVDRLPGLIERDELLDVIGGAAGCIGSLISLYRCAQASRTLSAAIQCGDHLIARAHNARGGMGWIARGSGGRPLTGFSHGAAGIAWALLELAALTGEERFRTTALSAIAYERSLFSSEASNWPDLRDLTTPDQTENSHPPRFVTAWCHGAPGIGLARLRSLPYLDDVETRSEVDTALRTTLAQGFGGNHSLCHGDLGNLELLIQASQTLDNPQWSVEIDRLSAIILESIHRDGWLCGIPANVESPGLMTGLAGIGYGLLRLAESSRVPSVLLLEPPPVRPTSTELVCD